MFVLLAIFGIFFLWGMASDHAKSKILGGAMAGTFMGCAYLLFVGFVIVGSIPLIIFLAGTPQAILPLFIGFISIIVILRVLGH